MPTGRKTAKFSNGATAAFVLFALTAGVAIGLPARAAGEGVGTADQTSDQVLEIPRASRPDGGWHLSREVTTSTGPEQSQEKEAKRSGAEAQSANSEAITDDPGAEAHDPETQPPADPSLAGIDDYLDQQAGGFAATSPAVVLLVPRPLLGLHHHNLGRFGMPPNPFFGSPNLFAPPVYDPYRLQGPARLGPSRWRAPFMPRAGYLRR